MKSSVISFLCMMLLVVIMSACVSGKPKTYLIETVDTQVVGPRWTGSSRGIRTK